MLAMKITLENLGHIKKVEYEVGDLTVLCGENNSGKTQAMYAVYGILSFLLSNTIREVKRIFSSSIGNNVSYANTLNDYMHDHRLKKNITQYYEGRDSKYGYSISHVVDYTMVYLKTITQIFNEDFLDTTFQGDITANGCNINTVEIITVERSGITMFSNELNIQTNRIITELIKRGGVSEHEMSQMLIGMRYPIPITDNVDFFSKEMRTETSEVSFIVKEYPAILDLFIKICGGVFNSMDKLQHHLWYQIDSSKNNRKNTPGIIKHYKTDDIHNQILKAFNNNRMDFCVIHKNADKYDHRDMHRLKNLSANYPKIKDDVIAKIRRFNVHDDSTLLFIQIESGCYDVDFHQLTCTLGAFST